MNRAHTNFSKPTREQLAMSANFRCARPGCGLVTHFYDPTEGKTINIQGQAAHIHAASLRGPRFDLELTDSQVKHYDNGVWLCANCATLIDRLPADYPPEMLRSWQEDAVERIRRTGLGISQHLRPDPRGDSRVVSKFLEEITAILLPRWRPGEWVQYEAHTVLQKLRRTGQWKGPGNNDLAIQHSIRNRQLSICELALNQVTNMHSRERLYETTYDSCDRYDGHKPTSKRVAEADEARYREIRRLHDELRRYLNGPPMALGDTDW